LVAVLGLGRLAVRLAGYPRRGRPRLLTDLRFLSKLCRPEAEVYVVRAVDPDRAPTPA
jgi:hypothetical protein